MKREVTRYSLDANSGIMVPDNIAGMYVRFEDHTVVLEKAAAGQKLDERTAQDVVRMRQELDAVREQRDRLLRAYGTRTIVPEAHVMDSEVASADRAIRQAMTVIRAVGILGDAWRGGR